VIVIVDAGFAERFRDRERLRRFRERLADFVNGFADFVNGSPIS
jgi:hypothetical protein